VRDGKQYTYGRPLGVFGNVIDNYHTLAVSPNYPILTSRLYFSVHRGGSVSRLPWNETKSLGFNPDPQITQDFVQHTVSG